jgi:hypothetical protein
LFCGIVHWVVVVEPAPPPVFEDDVVVVTLVDVVVEFELLDGDELQAARPRAKATDANPSRDRFFRLALFRLVPRGACSCDMNSILWTSLHSFPRTTSEGVDVFRESPATQGHWAGDSRCPAQH